MRGLHSILIKMVSINDFGSCYISCFHSQAFLNVLPVGLMFSRPLILVEMMFSIFIDLVWLEVLNRTTYEINEKKKCNGIVYFHRNVPNMK